jgi:uncharacterized membrane protein YhaH (DUF805 family)
MGQLLFGFSGRLPRLRYFLLSLIPAAVAFATGIFLAMNAGAGLAVFSEPRLVACMVVLVLAWIVGLSLTVRRLHDLNLSGWWILAIWIVPAALEAGAVQALNNPQLGSLLSSVASLLIGLWLCLAPGTRGANRFGPDPRGAG